MGLRVHHAVHAKLPAQGPYGLSLTKSAVIVTWLSAEPKVFLPRKQGLSFLLMTGEFFKYVFQTELRFLMFSNYLNSPDKSMGFVATWLPLGIPFNIS